MADTVYYYSLRDADKDYSSFAVVASKPTDEATKNAIRVAIGEEYDAVVNLPDFNLADTHRNGYSEIEVTTGEFKTSIEITRTWMY